MALSKIEQVIALLQGEYETRTGQVILFHYGLLERDKHRLPPCIVWIPQPGSVTRPKPISTGNAKALPTTLWAKSSVFRVECWAANSADAEALHENFLALIAKDLKGSVEVGAWGWVTQEAANAALNVRTSKIYQSLTVWSPITDQPTSLVEIARVAHTVIIGDDWDGEVVVTDDLDIITGDAATTTDAVEVEI